MIPPTDQKVANSSLVNIPKKELFKATTPQITLKEIDLSLFGQKNMQDCQIAAEKSTIFSNNTTECTNVTCRFTTSNKYCTILKTPKAYINHTTKQLTFPDKVYGTFKACSPQQQEFPFIWNIEQQQVGYNATNRTITGKHSKLIWTSKKEFFKKNPYTKIKINAKKSTINLENETIILEQEVLTTLSKEENPSTPSSSPKKSVY